MNDLYDSGTPKYSTAEDIYDALCELVQTEEMSILGEMFENISYDNQTYYYTDKGDKLKEKFEELSDYGSKMWLIRLAIWQIDDCEIWDVLYDCLIDDDIAKRLAFKKMFTDEVLRGYKDFYDVITEKWEYELHELNRWGNWSVYDTLRRILQENAMDITRYDFDKFIRSLYDKAKGLRLIEEIKLVNECRALLSSYDDFLYGLRSNQYLYNTLEADYGNKLARLQAAYDEQVKRLLLSAEAQGVTLQIDDLKYLPEVKNDERA